MTDRARDLRWLDEGTSRLSAVVAGLADAELSGPSLLPGWSRAHVLAHIARNADALDRLLTWARTGVETPMYAGAAQRDAEIETSALQPPEFLRHDVEWTAVALRGALTSLPGPAWATGLRSAQGRAITAEGVPWMRVREVWLHAVDLDADLAVGDIPPELLTALLDDVTRRLGDRDGCPAVLLVATDTPTGTPPGPGIASVTGRWVIGPRDGTPAVVRAPAAQLLAWVTGRAGAPTDLTDPTAPAPPALPRWL